MKRSTIFLAGLVSTNETNRRPLERLTQLFELSGDFLVSGAFNHKTNIWIQRWIGKFGKNADRMRDAYNRCGFYDKKYDLVVFALINSSHSITQSNPLIYA